MGNKTFTVTGKDILLQHTKNASMRGEIVSVVCSGEGLQCSDGYHTFREVYDHRMAIFAVLLNHIHQSFELNATSSTQVSPVWKSKHHSDCLGVPLGARTSDEEGADDPCCSMFEGDFVCGIGTEPGEQITYHLPLKMFDDVQVPELEKAPAYDGHTSADVLERLKCL